MNKEEKIYKVYLIIKGMNGRATSKVIAEKIKLSQRTIQRILRILVDNGFIEPIRWGMKLYYRVAKPLTIEDIKNILAKKTITEPLIYQYSKMIKEDMIKLGILGDLIGAAKIHDALGDRHSRITVDVGVVILTEYAEAFKHLMSIRGFIGYERGIHSDYRFIEPQHDIKVDVMYGGFKEEGRKVIDLSPILRKYHEIPLEYAVIAKLTRRNFEERTDGYDVTVSLYFLRDNLFKEALKYFREQSQSIYNRILKNLQKVKDYIFKEYIGEDIDILVEHVNKFIRFTEEIGKFK